MIYKCINKNNIVPKSVYKWNEELSPHGLIGICIQDGFKVLKLLLISDYNVYGTESFIRFSLFVTTLKNQTGPIGKSFVKVFLYLKDI